MMNLFFPLNCLFCVFGLALIFLGSGFLNLRFPPRFNKATASTPLRPTIIIKKPIVALLSIMIMLLVPFSYSYAENIRIGVLANKGIDDAKARWTPTAEYLQKKIPGSSFSIVPLTFEQVGPTVNKGEVDFLITNPAMYVEMEARHGVTRILTLIDNGLTQFGGVIFCKSDRQDIQTINDLKSKSFMAVEKDSLGGWLTVYGELTQNHIDPFKDFTPMLFGGNHKAVVQAVKDGKVVAGTVRTDSLERMAKEGSIKLSDFRVINEKHYTGFPYRISTPLYPEWPLAKLKHISDAVAKKVAMELLSMPADSPANKAAGIGGWTTPLDYQLVHDLMKDLRIGPYKEYGQVTLLQVTRQYWHWFLLVLVVLLLTGSGLVVIYRINRKLKAINLQRQQAEEKLKKTHQENEMVLNSMGEGLVVMDQKGLITYFNPTALALTGFEISEVMGRNLHDLIHHKKPDGTPYPREECPMYATLTTGQISRVSDEVFWTKAGVPLPVAYMTTPIERDGQIVGVVGTFRDITQRKQAEEELKRAHHENEMILNSIGEGLFGVDQQGNINFVNPAALHLTGYDAEEVMGKNLHELIHHKRPNGTPYPREECPMYATLTRGQISQVDDEVFWTKKGDPLPVEYMTTPIKRDGQIVGVVGSFRDIAWQKQAEAELKKAHQENEMILNSVGEGLFGIDPLGNVTFANPAALALTGFEISEVMGKNLHELILYKKADGTPYPREECPMYATLMTGKTSHITDEVFWTKEGRPLSVEYVTTPIEQDGWRVGVVLSFRDITWRKQAEADLQKAHQQNETILNAIGEGLFEIDRRGKVIFVNPAAVKLTGYGAEELVGRNLHELIHYKKADGTPYPELECPIHATFQDGEERKILDDVFWTKKGEPLAVAYVTTPIFEDGQVAGVVGSFRDISWRKLAEAELKKSNEYLEKVFDSSAEGIGIVDSKGMVSKWNKASEEIYGYSFKELQGKPAFDLYADKEELAKMIIQLRRDGYVKNYEIHMKRKDGNTFPCSLSVKVLRDEEGKNMGSVTVARDLTELKEKEAKIHAANEQLQVLVNETNQRNRNMILLQEMTDVFQSCQTSGETYSAIAHFVPKFFPEYGGALYILNNSKNLYEMTSIWGDAASMELVFNNDECWSLRRSRAYLVADSGNTMNCRHVSSSPPGSYLCVPMMAQGEIMGIFHLRKAKPGSKEEIQAIGQFATTISEAMAMALANLKLRETLRNQAIRDGLTGLFNRRYLEETMERELSRGKRQGNPLGVIMLDLDHFKDYNDTYGHNAGDELLIALGQLIQDQVRREDIACRYGGEEFLLIMPGAPLEIAVERANELNLAVKQLHKNSPSMKPITISAGVAIFPDHGSNGKDVIRAADAALYRAKEEGRDRVVVASSLSSLAMAN